MKPFLALLVVSVAAGGCNVQVGDNGGVSFDVAGGRARDEWTRTYTLPEGGRLEIINSNGRIDASAGEGREVTVRAERATAAGSDEEAQQLLAQLQMREEVTPTSVTIEARTGDGQVRRRHSVSYTLRIPSGLEVSLKTENGGIRLQNVNGRITVASANGGIDAEGLSGSLSAESVNGGIEIDIVSVAGDVTLSTVNGGIELGLPADVKASIDATCVNGGINVDDELNMAVSEDTRRRVTGTINGGGVKVSATTVNGGVRISAGRS